MNKYLACVSKKLNLNEVNFRKNEKIVSDNIFKEIQQGLNDPWWLLYIDATALYSGIMTLPIPYKDFKYENY